MSNCSDELKAPPFAYPPDFRVYQPMKIFGRRHRAQSSNERYSEIRTTRRGLLIAALLTFLNFRENTPKQPVLRMDKVSDLLVENRARGFI